MAKELRYTRSRFSTPLIEDRLYTAGHYWLERDEAGERWRVGLTRFAIRMLGEAVELDLEVEPGVAIETGQVIGWLEGFKAVTDLFSPMAGTYERRNPTLDTDINVLATDPYVKGWLFEMRGQPGEECVDVHAYVQVLDTTIDAMIGKRNEPPPDAEADD